VKDRDTAIEVYQTDPWDMALIWPEGLAALLFPGENSQRS
jgi:hypothetical protein